MGKIKEEIENLAKSEEDFISYALFPQMAKNFLENRNRSAQQPVDHASRHTGSREQKNGFKEDDKMNLQEIKELVKLVDQTAIAELSLDSAAYPGWEVPPHYDSLIAKLIAQGRDRDEAVARMQRALEEFIIEGIKTTIPFHQLVLQNAFFRRGEVYTNFIQRRILMD